MSCEIPVFYREQIRKAKKSHKCCECGNEIKPGETFACCSVKMDSDIEEFKQHMRCFHFARHLNLDFHDECVIGFCAIDEEIESYEHDYPEIIRELWDRVKEGFEYTPPVGSRSEASWKRICDEIQRRKDFKEATKNNKKRVFAHAVALLEVWKIECPSGFEYRAVSRQDREALSYVIEAYKRVKPKHRRS